MPLAKKLIEPQDISILLIEDSLGDAAAITKALVHGESLYSFHITRKGSLLEGLHFLETLAVDVVLLDLNLPDATDLKAIESIHDSYPDLPIVVLSGHSDMNMVHKALHSGAQEFLVKGECSGISIRQSIYQAIVRKQIERDYQRGERL